MATRRPAQHQQRFSSAALASLFALLAVAALWAPVAHAWAQAAIAPTLTSASSTKLSVAGVPAKPASAPKIAIKPGWQDLSPSQQVSLKPLSEKWNTLAETQKRKWIAIAANYPKLAPAEQEKLHARMTEWVSLSQQQRAQARLNFAESKKLTPTQKAATWNAYQALSPEEKQKLARSAPPKLAGAAAAAKPVPSHKLTNVPVTKQSAKQVPKMAAASHSVDHNTLLPQSKPESSTPHQN